MKSSTAYVFALVATGFVAAQSLADLPGCATPCALSSLPNTCALTDYSCYCKDSSWLSSLAPCVKKDCNSADQQKVLTIAQGLCQSYGVTIPNDFLSTALASASASGSASSPTGSANTTTARSPTTTATATQTSANAAVPAQVGMVGSGLMVAAAGVAMFVL